MQVQFPKIFIAAAAISLVTACSSGSAEVSADDFPNDTVTIIVPYAAGGPSDIASRAFAKVFEDDLGESVVVENIEGASGALGMQEMIGRPPDGHTMQFAASTGMVVGPLASDVGYTLDDAKMVGAFGEFPYVMVVNANSPWKSAKEFFAEAKANPGKLSVGTPGAASQGSAELERLAETHDTKFNLVPFDGNSKLNAALQGENVDAIFLVASPDVTSLIDSGKFRPLAIDAKERVDYLDIPTFEELGFEGINQGVSYYGLCVNSETPEDVRSKLEDSMKSALKDKRVRKAIGEQYIPEKFVDGDSLSALFSEQRDAYKPILEEIQ